MTDAEGRFALADLPAGTHRLLARHLGFSPAWAEVTVAAGATAELRVTLPQVAVRLAAGRGGRALVEATEDQRLVGATFVRGSP